MPKNLAHYIENIGTEPVRVLNVLSRAEYRDMSLNNWLALTPPDFVRGHVDVGDPLTSSLHQSYGPILKG